MQYFDAVLDKRYLPVFNGTPEHTRNWLLKHTEIRDGYVVCHGYSLKVVSVKVYLASTGVNNERA